MNSAGKCFCGNTSTPPWGHHNDQWTVSINWILCAILGFSYNTLFGDDKRETVSCSPQYEWFPQWEFALKSHLQFGCGDRVDEDAREAWGVLWVKLNLMLEAHQSHSGRQKQIYSKSQGSDLSCSHTDTESQKLVSISFIKVHFLKYILHLLYHVFCNCF